MIDRLELGLRRLRRRFSRSHWTARWLGMPAAAHDGLAPGLLHFRLKDGPLTLGRFDGDSGGYRLGGGEGRTVDGPYTQEFYAWLEVDNWPRWEEQLVRGPYMHHCSFIYDHCAGVLAEATRFLPGLEPESLGKPPSVGSD